LPSRNLRWRKQEEKVMTLGTILLIVLVLFLVGALPNWGYSSGWGYGPSGGLGLVLVIVLILVVMGKI
jgi:Protein of unknown function (DUF3309)